MAVLRCFTRKQTRTAVIQGPYSDLFCLLRLDRAMRATDSRFQAGRSSPKIAFAELSTKLRDGNEQGLSFVSMLRIIAR